MEQLSLLDHALIQRSDAHRDPRYGVGLLAPEECREVYEKDIDGVAYYCPAHTHLRSMLSLVAFERTIPDAVVPFFFSEKEVATARREIRKVESLGPPLHPPIVQSTWHVPPRWFVCFRDDERRIEHNGEHPTIRYETWMPDARRRVGEALSSLTGGIVHPVIIGMIYELREWLAHFAEDAIVELDYASVATLFDAEELADDHSAADVWNAIAALGEGDGMTASLHYRRVNERWTRPRLRESVN